MPYDQHAATTLNLAGNKTVQRLKELSGLDSPSSQEFAEAACQQAFGKVPCDIHTMTDEEIKALIPIVQAANAALELIAALLAVRKL